MSSNTVKPRHNEPQFNEIQDVTHCFHFPILVPLKTVYIFEYFFCNLTCSFVTWFQFNKIVGHLKHVLGACMARKSRKKQNMSA